MPLNVIKNRLFQELEELFVLAEVDELAADDEAHRIKLEAIARICNILGIKTELTVVELNLFDKT